MTLGIRGIEGSAVYQDIFAKGEARGGIEHARAAWLRVGKKSMASAVKRYVGRSMPLTMSLNWTHC